MGGSHLIGWEQLGAAPWPEPEPTVERFPCGHAKTPDNCYATPNRSGSLSIRCRACHRVQCREWYRAHAGKGRYTWKRLNGSG
jgi:hypothetical protein